MKARWMGLGTGVALVLAAMAVGRSQERVAPTAPPANAAEAVALARDTPAVWSVTQTSATVSWFTFGPVASASIEYWPAEAGGSGEGGGGGGAGAEGSKVRVTAVSRPWPLIESGPGLRQHVATVSGLRPGTRYHYRVLAGETALTPTPGTAAADFSFTTAPSAEERRPITFAVMGDGGEGNKYQRGIVAQMETQPFEFLLHVGDVVYDVGSDAEWSLHYYPIYKNLIRSRPWFLALGNHEYLSAPPYYVVGEKYAVKRERLLTREAYEASSPRDPAPVLYKPQARGAATGYFENAVLPGNEKWYSFDWGPVHFVVLDSNRNHLTAEENAEQLRWLEADLKASSAPWKVAAFHHPMASVGKAEYVHTSASLSRLREEWHPILERGGVRVVFSGHDHNYQRTAPITVGPRQGPTTAPIRLDRERGIVHIVTGGGGGGITDRSVRELPEWHSGVFFKRHHFLIVRADEESLEIIAIGDADLNTPGLSERQVIGGPSETLDQVILRRDRQR